MNRCQKCQAELAAGARFCNICGALQNPENAQPVPPTPPGPARIIQPSTKRTYPPQVSGDNPNQSAKTAHSPILPKRPNSRKVISPIALPQRDTPQAVSSPPPATAHNSSDLATLPENPQPETQLDSSATPTHLLPSLPASTQPPQRPGSAYAPADTQPQNEHELPDLPTQQVRSDIKPGHQRLPVVRRSTTPSKQTSPAHDLDELPTSHLPLTNGQNGLVNAQTMSLLSPESFAVTSKAAEHWRNSWRERQYAEAGPVENVSRGHAAVPMPLLAMQHSFARMRAIARTNKQQGGRNTSFRSWITLFLMICIIAGLGAYIISTYLPNSSIGAERVVLPANTMQPSLTLQGKSSGTFAIGQTIHLHGNHFGPNDTVTFLLDTTSPITGASGNKLSTQADSQGAFDVALAIGSDWTAGTHTIETVDSSGNQNAYLTIQVVPAGTPVTTSPNLSVTMDSKPVQMLTFKAVAGLANPDPQTITITNTSGAPLKWSATASASNNLSWLIINDHHTSGLLAISEPDTLLISVNITALTSGKPYTGQIVFTINDKEQLTLPVQLQITDATSEMVFSPSPLIAQLGSGNTCGTNATLTLINLGNEYINWTVKPDLSNISFVDPATFKLKESGQLAPSGQDHDTQVLVLQCNTIQVGRPYRVSVYANSMSWSELVIIQ